MLVTVIMMYLWGGFHFTDSYLDSIFILYYIKVQKSRIILRGCPKNLSCVSMCNTNTHCVGCLPEFSNKVNANSPDSYERNNEKQTYQQFTKVNP